MEQNVNITEPTTPIDTGAVDSGQVAEATPAIDATVQPDETAVGTPEQPQPTDSGVNEFGLTAEELARVNADPIMSKQYKSLQASYTKKMQEASQTKELSFAEKMQDPVYRQQVAEWAQQNTPMEHDPEQQSSLKFHLENWDNPRLTNEQRGAFFNNLSELEQISFNTALAQRQTMIKQSQLDMEKEDAANIQTYGDSYKQLLKAKGGINETITGLKKGKIPLTADFVYKALNHDSYGQMMLEKGRQEAITNRTNAINGNLNQPSGTTPSTVPNTGTLQEQMMAAVNAYGENVPEVFR